MKDIAEIYDEHYKNAQTLLELAAKEKAARAHRIHQTAAYWFAFEDLGGLADGCQRFKMQLNKNSWDSLIFSAGCLVYAIAFSLPFYSFGG